MNELWQGNTYLAEEFSSKCRLDAKVVTGCSDCAVAEHSCGKTPSQYHHRSWRQNAVDKHAAWRSSLLPPVSFMKTFCRSACVPVCLEDSTQTKPEQIVNCLCWQKPKWVTERFFFFFPFVLMSLRSSGSSYTWSLKKSALDYIPVCDHSVYNLGQRLLEWNSSDAYKKKKKVFRSIFLLQV